MVGREGLGQHLGEDQDEEGHDQRRGGDPPLFAQVVNREACGDRRGQDVDHVVPDQNGDQQARRGAEQVAHRYGRRTAPLLNVLLDVLRSQPHQRDLTAREEGRGEQTDQDQ